MAVIASIVAAIVMALSVGPRKNNYRGWYTLWAVNLWLRLELDCFGEVMVSC